MSDQTEGPRKPPENEDVDELPSESGPSSKDTSNLSLEEQIAQIENLDTDDEEKAKKKDRPG